MIPSVHDPKSPCPHCQAVAGVEKSARLRYQCAICGGPRIPVDAPGAQAGEPADRALRTAQEARVRVRVRRIGAVLVGAFGLLSWLLVALVLAVVGLSLVLKLMTLAVITTPLVIAALVWRKSTQQAQFMDQQLDLAWRMAGAELIQQASASSTQGMDPETFRQALRLEPEASERLLAELETYDLASTLTGPDGQVTYYSVGTTRSPAPRIRIGALESGASNSPDPEDEQEAAPRNQREQKPL